MRIIEENPGTKQPLDLLKEAVASSMDAIEEELVRFFLDPSASESIKQLSDQLIMEHTDILDISVQSYCRYLSSSTPKLLSCFSQLIYSAIHASLCFSKDHDDTIRDLCNYFRVLMIINHLAQFPIRDQNSSFHGFSCLFAVLKQDPHCLGKLLSWEKSSVFRLLEIVTEQTDSEFLQLILNLVKPMSPVSAHFNGYLLLGQNESKNSVTEFLRFSSQFGMTFFIHSFLTPLTDYQIYEKGQYISSHIQSSSPRCDYLSEIITKSLSYSPEKAFYSPLLMQIVLISDNNDSLDFVFSTVFAYCLQKKDAETMDFILSFPSNSPELNMNLASIIIQHVSFSHQPFKLSRFSCLKQNCTVENMMWESVYSSPFESSKPLYWTLFSLFQDTFRFVDAARTMLDMVHHAEHEAVQDLLTILKQCYTAASSTLHLIPNEKERTVKISNRYTEPDKSIRYNHNDTQTFLAAVCCQLEINSSDQDCLLCEDELLHNLVAQGRFDLLFIWWRRSKRIPLDALGIIVEDVVDKNLSPDSNWPILLEILWEVDGPSNNHVYSLFVLDRVVDRTQNVPLDLVDLICEKNAGRNSISNSTGLLRLFLRKHFPEEAAVLVLRALSDVQREHCLWIPIGLFRQVVDSLSQVIRTSEDLAKVEKLKVLKSVLASRILSVIQSVQ